MRDAHSGARVSIARSPLLWVGAGIAVVAAVCGLVADEFIAEAIAGGPEASRAVRIAALAIGVAAAVATAVLVPLQSRRSERRSLLAAARDGFVVDAAGRVPTIAGIDASRDLGVHPAFRSVPYLERGIENEVLGVLRAPGAVVVVGRPLAGKSRLLAEVIAADPVLRQRPLLVARRPDAVRSFIAHGGRVRDSIVLIPDLAAALAGDGLSASDLEQLLEAGNAVAATIEARAFEDFRPVSSTGSERAWAVLSSFTAVRLDAKALAEPLPDGFPPGSQARAEVEAVGIGAYLAGASLASELVRAAADAHPYGYALIRTAIDWARTGIAAPIPKPLGRLGAERLLLRLELADDPGERAEEESWAEAPIQRSGRAVFRLLDPGDGGASWTPYPPLVRLVSEGALFRAEIPGEVWALVTQADAPADGLVAAGTAAYEAGEREVAAALWQRAVDAFDDPRGRFGVAAIRLEDGDRDRAAADFERAADDGHAAAAYWRAMMFDEDGDRDAERAWHLRAAELGSMHAMAELGRLHHEDGDDEEAERWFARAAEAGDATSLFNLGMLRSLSGDEVAAEQLWRAAADLDEPHALRKLLVITSLRGEVEAATEFARRGAAVGERGCMNDYGLILWQSGREFEAEGWFVRAADLGEPNSMTSLGAILHTRGSVEEAEAWYERAAALGEPTAMSNLALMATERGDAEAAAGWRARASRATALVSAAAGLGATRDVSLHDMMLTPPES